MVKAKNMQFLKGLYTKTYYCRECKEYYELAYEDGYVRFDKEILTLYNK